MSTPNATVTTPETNAPRATGPGRRIVIDGSMARSGGGFTYLVNMLPRLAETRPEDSIRVYLRSERIRDSLPRFENLEIVLLPEAGLLERIRFTYREMPRLVRAWDADLYYSVGEWAPVGLSCKSMAAFRNPNVFSDLPMEWPAKQKARLSLLRGIAGLTARACDRILFVSQDSADWIGDAMAMPERKRVAVPHGIDLSRWAPPAVPASREGGFILSVSSVYRYKNYVRLIEAYAELVRRQPATPDLVIIGDDQDPAYSARMREARERTGEIAERIHILGEVPYAEVRRYYAEASLFVFPSYLETFGHPLLESMASGLPLVAADIPVFRETAGDAAFYADPHDASALARAMETALFSPECAARAREARPRARARLHLGRLGGAPVGDLRRALRRSRRPGGRPPPRAARAQPAPAAGPEPAPRAEPLRPAPPLAAEARAPPGLRPPPWTWVGSAKPGRPRSSPRRKRWRRSFPACDGNGAPVSVTASVALPGCAGGDPHMRRRPFRSLLLTIALSSMALLGSNCPGLNFWAIIELKVADVDRYLGEFEPAVTEDAGDGWRSTPSTPKAATARSASRVRRSRPSRSTSRPTSS